MNKKNYIRKSHSFTREALDDLGILNRYMGDIGESAVLRYLIINEIRKVPAFSKPPIVIKDHCESVEQLSINEIKKERKNELL